MRPAFTQSAFVCPFSAACETNANRKFRMLSRLQNVEFSAFPHCASSVRRTISGFKTQDIIMDAHHLPLGQIP